MKLLSSSFSSASLKGRPVESPAREALRETPGSLFIFCGLSALFDEFSTPANFDTNKLPGRGIFTGRGEALSDARKKREDILLKFDIPEPHIYCFSTRVSLLSINKSIKKRFNLRW